MGWLVISMLAVCLEGLADTVLLLTPWMTWAFLQAFRMMLLAVTMPPPWVTLLTFLLVLSHIYSRRAFTTFQRLNITGPRPLPLIGNLLPVILKGVLRADQDHVLAHGKIVGTYEGHTPVLLVADPRILKQIMIKQFHNFQDRRGGSMHKFPMRRALTSLRGPHWRHVRSLLTPTFSTAKLKNMVPLIADCCHTLVNNLQEKANSNQQVDLKSCCGAFTMDVIASTAFGIQIDSQNDPDSPFVRHARRVFNFRVRPAVTLVVLVLGSVSTWIIKMLRINFFPKDVTDFFVSVIDDVMKHRKDNSETQTDFLRLMMNAQVDDPDLGSMGPDQQEVIQGPDGVWTKQGLTHEEILAQSLLFFLAGYETTATTLNFAGYCLATNPQYQTILINEIDRTCQDERDIDMEAVAKMTFLDMVVCETLRMYPPAGRITRICSRNIEVEGVSIETGTVIAIPIYSIHHDPQLWPDPNVFNPYRFEASQRHARDVGTWMPFGMGPRQCIGVRLAMLEIKMALIFLLRHFRFHTCSETQIPLKMKKRGLLQPENPIHIKLAPRERPSYNEGHLNEYDGSKSENSES